MLVQLLAVARDEQEGVVGPGAEDEDGDDARVEGEAARLPDDSGHPPGHLVGDADDGERDEPQDGGAVGEQEQQRDDPEGHREEGEVGAVEGRGDVGAEGRAAGHLHVELGRCVVGHLGAQVLDGRDLGGAVLAHLDGHGDRRGHPVLAHLRVRPRGAEAGRELAEGTLVGARQAGVVPRRRDEQDGSGVAAGEALELLRHHRRLRRRRVGLTPRRRVRRPQQGRRHPHDEHGEDEHESGPPPAEDALDEGSAGGHG